MIWIGVLIVIVAFAAILKNYEARMILIAAGALMALVAGIGGVENCFNGLFDAFIAQLINPSLVPAICACMGFSAVMSYTGCTDDLVNLLTKPLKKVRFALVPGAVIITWLINIVILSSSSCAATVGVLLIPMLVGFGVNPITAAAAVLIGTWGNIMNPGNSFNIQIAELAGVPALDVCKIFAIPAVIIMLISTALLTVIDVILAKKKSVASERTEEKKETVQEESKKINPLKVVTPILPIIALMLGSFGVIPNLDITIWMILGSIVGMLIDYKRIQEGVKQFFGGVGSGYRDIVTLMAAAAVFTFGMSAIGLTGSLVELMKESTSIAQLGATFGPFIIAALSGSGNAATIAFNTSITPFAEDFGYSIAAMGAMAEIAGCLGRDLSPVAGVTIIVAKMAGVNPMDVAKRAAIPMLVALIIFMVVLL